MVWHEEYYAFKDSVTKVSCVRVSGSDATAGRNGELGGGKPGVMPRGTFQPRKSLANLGRSFKPRSGDAALWGMTGEWSSCWHRGSSRLGSPVGRECIPVWGKVIRE